MKTRRFPWLFMLALVFLVLSPMPASAAQQSASPAQESEDYQQILLGEFVELELASGETVGYTLYIPETGIYTILPDDYEEAELFDLIITDEDGVDVFDGMLLDAIDLELEDGGYALTINAVEDALLSFFMMGAVGTMNDSERTPGKLYPGSTYFEDDVSTSRVANLTIPDAGHPQLVLIYIEANEEDAFTLSAEGEDIGYLYVDTDESESGGHSLSFWSEGGDYTLTAEPYERRSGFSLAIFVVSTLDTLPFDEEFDDAMQENLDTVVYQLTLDSLYEELEVELIGDDGDDVDLDLSVVDSLYNAEFSHYSTDSGSEEYIEMSNLFPGTYYVVVRNYSGGEPGFSLFVSGDAGDAPIVLESNEEFENEIATDETHFYQLDVDEAGALVTIDLVSVDEEHDIDLAVGLQPEDTPWTSAHLGGFERLYFVAPIAGTYWVQVHGYSGEGEYGIVADVEEQAPVLASDELLEGELNVDGFGLYQFEVEEAGLLLSLLLLGDGEDDLDLTVNLFDLDGNPLQQLTSVSPGADEIVSQVTSAPGLAEIVVSAISEGAGDDYSLLLRLENPAEVLESAE